MHHLIYPSKDTFITSRAGLESKNFGLNETFQIGTSNIIEKSLSSTKKYSFNNTIFNSQPMTLFTGTLLSGSFKGTVQSANGTISGSILMFSASYFSGLIDGVSTTQSGSISGSLINGTITGSIISPYIIEFFNGQLTGSTICLSGTASGIDIRNEYVWVSNNVQYSDRTLLKFDLTNISKSIVNGDILTPQFFINVKICSEYNLPFSYIIYALPVSQSWNAGNGYLYNGGSDLGVNWIYKDNNYGIQWNSGSITTTTHSPIDFITNPSLLTASFQYGGSTWYTTSYCSQSFGYKSSDINMDVTPIVKKWLNGTFLNEGIILIHSDELQATGSGVTLKYFGHNTNTIYTPYLDMAWDDSTFITGSIFTGSVQINQINSGISASIVSGSSFSTRNGLSGSFSGSAYLITSPNYLIVNNQIFNSYPTDVVVVDTWYANNGYHYDSWQTAWQLDPNSGGFLPNTDIQQTISPPIGNTPILQFTGSFTGSFSGTASYVSGSIIGSSNLFYTDYFSGSVDNVSLITHGNISGSQINGIITGSVSSVSQLGLFNGQLTSSYIFLNGTGSGRYLDSTFSAINGFVDGIGIDGNIKNMSVSGPIQGLLGISQTLINGECGNYYSASISKAIFTDGYFSGSTFTALYFDYKFENGQLSGSWIPSIIRLSNINIPIPSGKDPYAYANIYGHYINGTALGIYNIYSTNSASFNGQMTDGILIGGNVLLQLSGSVYTSSFNYTSSVNMTSSILVGLDINRPFSINLQNIQSEYKCGDIVRINVFGRKKFPLKYFGKSTQQEQYLIPEFLLSSSYYSLKDNQTSEIVLDFDNYTKISCDYPYGNYFMIDTTGLPQERYYSVLIKITDINESYTIDTGKTFKITR